MPQHRHTVLLVDDYADTRDAFVLIADMANVDLVAVASGGGALARLRDGLRPCLILLDMNLPGMDGLAFRREQLADPALAAIPVVAMSGGGTTVETEAHALGIGTFLRKPVRVAEVLALFAEFCSN
jgi:CheY-like chemotaxis protein